MTFFRSPNGGELSLVFVGGFLGSGRTSLTRIAQQAFQAGRRPALIVNDQASDLVNRATAQSTGSHAVAEVGGGCNSESAS